MRSHSWPRRVYVEGLGVSDGVYADLQTIVNSSYFTIPDYVANLAGKVISGNPANAWY